MIRKGFTLIELLVVIAITAMLVVAGVSSLSHSKTSRQVKTTAENLRNFLTEARAMAMNPEASSFGTEKIKVMVNSDGKLVSLLEIKNTDSTILSNFKPPNKINIKPSADPIGDNMKCIGECETTAQYYFSFLAKEESPRSIGQITDYKNPNLPVKINVESGSIKFQLTIDHLTGNIGIESVL